MADIDVSAAKVNELLLRMKELTNALNLLQSSIDHLAKVISNSASQPGQSVPLVPK